MSSEVYQLHTIGDSSEETKNFPVLEHNIMPSEKFLLATFAETPQFQDWKVTMNDLLESRLQRETSRGIIDGGSAPR